MYSRGTMLALAEILGTEARIAHATSIAMGIHPELSGEAWAYAKTANALATRAAHFAAGALGPEEEHHEPEVPFTGELEDYE